MTYMVMENHLSYSIVLDEEGRFIKVANLNYEVGDILERVELIKEKPNIPYISKKTIGAISSIAASFILIFTILLSPLYAQFGTVYLNINPSVQMDLNKKGQVIKIIPKNKDAEILLEDSFKWKRKELKEVTQYLVNKAIEKGFLSDGGKITILIDSDNEEWYMDKEIKVQEELNKTLENKKDIELIIKSYGEKDIEEEKPMKKEIIIDESDYTDYTDYDKKDNKTKNKTKNNSKTNIKNNKKDDDDSGYTDYTDYDDDDKKEEIEKKKEIPKDNKKEETDYTDYDTDYDDTKYEEKDDDTDYDTDYDD